MSTTIRSTTIRSTAIRRLGEESEETSSFDSAEWKARVYYPGVPTKEWANIIELGDGQWRTDIDYKLLPGTMAPYLLLTAVEALKTPRWASAPVSGKACPGHGLSLEARLRHSKWPGGSPHSNSWSAGGYGERSLENAEKSNFDFLWHPLKFGGGRT